MMITMKKIMKQRYQQQNQCGSNDKVNTTTTTTSTVNDDEEDEDKILINGSKSTSLSTKTLQTTGTITKTTDVFIVHQKNFQDRQSTSMKATTKTKFICTVLLIFNILDSISTLIYDGVSEYQVMEGDTISLPCNISLKEWNQNQISLMVWYRSQNQGNPIYSIDTRNSLSKSRHQIMPELKGRIEMDFENDPPRLHIDSVQINDAGDYRCRVDYRMNRTKHFLIHLNVSVLPKNVVIRDLLGNIVQGMIQTPFNEGDKVTLFCDAIGGSPPPIVIWKNDDAKIIDDSYEMIMNDQNHFNGTIVRNILTIPQLDRGHLLQEITCEAYPPVVTTTAKTTVSKEQSLNWTTNNNNHQHHNSDSTTNKAINNNNNNHHNHYNHNSFVRRTSVVFDLNLRPLSVQIQVPNFQPNLNRSLPGTSQPSSSSSSSLSSLPYGTTLSTNNNNGNVLVVSAGKKTEIECRSWGSRPPAEITWWRASRRLPTSASRSFYTGKLTSLSSDEDSLSLSSTSSEQTTTNNNLTISMLTYTAAPEDDGQRLTCRADNTHLEQEEIEDSVIISVRYAPLLTLSLGPKIPENIREGSDVYLECISKSNPPLSEVVWLFEGKPLINDPVQGILVTNQSLVMQRVRREHRGYYQCAASNPEGISASNKIFLNVHFAPVCRPTQTIIYGVARTEQVSISCEVEAEPVAPIQFRWFFNNSFESYELPMKDYTLEIIQPNSSNSKELERKFFNNPDILSRLSLENVFATLATMNKHDTPSVARSNATYWPRTRIGYGLLYCLAENSVGNQRDPCVFTIVEAGPPNSVHDCRIVNVTMASFILECIPGENGGLRQIFHLEVYNIEKEHLQVNVTSMDEPVFAVENLPHDTAFMLNVFSSNAKGRSDSVTLRTATSAYAAKHTTNGKKQKAIILDDINQLMFNPIFGALIVALFSLILLCMATVVFIRSRFCLKNPNSSSITNNNNNNNNSKVDNNNVLAKNDCQMKCKEKFTLSCTSSPSMPSSSSLNHNQQQHPHHYIIGSQHHHQPPMPQQHQFSAESNLNQSTYYDYQPHITSGPHSTSLSTNDSTTAMTDLSSVVQLNKHLEPSSYYMASSSGSNNQHPNINNGNDLMQPVNIASAAATLLHRYPATSSDLMTNAFTYNVASSASTSTTTNAIYPISNDLIKIGTDLSAAACPYRIDASTISRRMPLLKPITGCMESLSSSTSDKTNDPDEEWSHNVKHNLHSNNSTNIIQQPGNQINPSFVPYTSDSMNNQSGALL